MKNILLKVFLLIIVLSNYIIAQNNLILSIENQRMDGDEFYFDIIFNAPNDNIFVGNAILLLEFNNIAFSNPNVYKDPLVSSDGGSCNFTPINIANEDIIQTRNKYFTNSSISILGNEIEIVVSIEPPIDADEFNSSIAKIDDKLFRLGSFKVDGLVDPSNIELRWKETCPTCLSYSEVKSINPLDFSESPTLITTLDPEEFVVAPGVLLSCKIHLEGAYNQSNMEVNLTEFLPLQNPYQTIPWQHTGNEEITPNFILNNNNIVDWILIELRSSIEGSSMISSRAALINKEGITVDLDGSSPISFPEVYPGSYYIVVHHRNHLSVMSRHPVFLSN